jgi:[amino group carrier protein]-L-2-aminoadipate 6-kinase
MMTVPLVVKGGGAAGIGWPAICADIADLVRSGQPVVLVHGGSAERDALGAALGVPTPEYVSPSGVSSRYTSQAGLDVLLLALGGRVKPRLVGLLAGYGVSAVGLTGLDAGLLRARAKPVRRTVVDGRVMLLREDHSGRLERVDPTLIQLLLAAGHVPVLSPPAVTGAGDPVNVNADRVAAGLAIALGARQLVLLTAAPGVLPAPGADHLSTMELSRTGPPPAFATGGMALKLIAAREALAGGVADVRVADGRVANPIRSALSGAGTQVRLDCEGDRDA